MIPGSKAPMEERERLMSKVVSLVVQANWKNSIRSDTGILTCLVPALSTNL
jgi:hypothetical protein